MLDLHILILWESVRSTGLRMVDGARPAELPPRRRTGKSWWPSAYRQIHQTNMAAHPGNYPLT